MKLESLVIFIRNDWISWRSWLYFVEGLLIVVGNAVTIAVFWKKRNLVKRASCLLINLAVADLLVGLALLTNRIVGLPRSEMASMFFLFVVFIFMSAGSSASIASLAVIAVERAFAVAKPLKHRAAPTSYYRRAIVVVWLVAIFATTFLAFTYTGHLNLRFITFTIAVALLSIVIFSYAVIWRYSTQRRMNNDHIHANQQAQTKKLAKTLAIVTFLSLATWLPQHIFFVVTPTEEVFSTHMNVYMALLWLWLSNSLLNPFVYVLRMPEFRQELKRTFHLGKLCQNRREVIPMRSVSVLSLGVEGSYKPNGTGVGL